MILLNYPETLNLKYFIDAIKNQHFSFVDRLKFTYNKNIIDPNICKELYPGKYNELTAIEHSTNNVIACIITDIDSDKTYSIVIDLLAWHVSE